VFSRKRRETEDGFELHFAVNHLGAFRLSSFIYVFQQWRLQLSATAFAALASFS